MEQKKINMYDFDGVVSIGVNPSKETDVIVTGRTYDEAPYVNTILKDRNIYNAVYFNPTPFSKRGNHSIKSRKNSGNHKAQIIDLFKKSNVEIDCFFEDDQIQADIILEKHPNLNVVMVISNLVEK